MTAGMTVAASLHDSCNKKGKKLQTVKMEEQTGCGGCFHAINEIAVPDIL